jgi:hypothetical protein
MLHIYIATEKDMDIHTYIHTHIRMHTYVFPSFVHGKDSGKRTKPIVMRI